MKQFLYIVFLCLVAIGCTQQQTAQNEDKEPALFTALTPEQSGVDFQNIINEGLNTNVLMYEYFYNGGGVAVGDLNNDGLDDLYFTANMSGNQLYLNKGKMKFDDITTAAGVAGRDGPWKTGVAMADVNGDGLLDIYVCYSGNLQPDKKRNQLFVNQGVNSNGVPTFTDQAAAYGLDSPASSTNAYFFDYDRDGDLDLFLLNHNTKSLPVLNESNTAEWIKTDDPVSGCRLYQNNSPKPSSAIGRGGEKAPPSGAAFVDVTKQSGINSSPLSYGLGAGIADINQDGWPDIYISNDYTIPDRLYINNHKGGFTDQLKTTIGQTSQFSMGNDVADINNDAAPDVFTLDMLPEDNRRQKLLMAPDNYEKFDMTVRSGFHYQYMRNMLHLGSKAPTGGLGTEIAQMAGISNTDWSWAALLADYDNDGWKDLYITNGYLRDYTNLDFLKYMDDYMKSGNNINREGVLNLVQQMPASNVVNYLFKNNKNLTFSNIGKNWGLGQSSNSNGAAYSDLDNDGDLDLVVNNINQPAFIYQNNAEKELKHHFLSIKLAGKTPNTQGIGAKVTLYSKGQSQYLEQMPARGYQSSVSPVLHFGLGATTSIDSLRVVWADGKEQLLTNLKVDQRLMIEQKNATNTHKVPKILPTIFAESPSSINFKNPVLVQNDFKRQSLMVSPQSFSGPCMTKADVNADGLEDVYVGGGVGQGGVLFLQNKSGGFAPSNQAAFEADKLCIDTDAVFFDANGDGFSDLYVCSGGYHNLDPNDALLQDRLYLNNGKGFFTKNLTALPAMLTSSSCVEVADINADGKLDLFVGGRVVPGRYPEAPRSYVLINTGGRFVDKTPPSLQKIGMVTDAAWQDLNQDRKPELIIVGEMMPVMVFAQKDGVFQDVSNDYFDKKYAGLWNKLLVDDLNGDGKADLVVGNWGLNSQLKATHDQPAELFYKDFDDNGTIDPILNFYIQGKSYPYVTRDEMIGQMPMLGRRFTDYKSYADATMKDVFSENELKDVGLLTANWLQTTCFLSSKSTQFSVQSLPLQAQLAPVFAIAVIDFDQDGKKDLLLCGNMNHARLRFGKFDANHGVLLRNNGKATFDYVPQERSGLSLSGDVRSLLRVNDKIIFGINQQPIVMYGLKK